MFEKLTQTSLDQMKNSPEQKKQVRIGCGVLVILFLIILFGSGGDKSTKRGENVPVGQDSTQIKATEQPQEEGKAEVAIDESKLPKYEIVYRDNVGRSEIIYVAMDPIKLQDGFERDIKNVVKNVASKEGYDKSYFVYDDKQFLEEYIAKYLKVQKDQGSTLVQLDAAVAYLKSPSYMQKNARHQVASTLGEKAIEMANTISYFSSATTDNKEVGKFVKTEDFDARNYQYEIK